MTGTRNKGQGTKDGRIARSTFHLSPPCLLVICLVLLTPGVTLAQAGADPTRPPAGMGVGGATNMDADAAGGMMLQSVLISPTGRAAIISGVMVKLGEKYGDAVLVKVAENEVVLKSGTTSQVLKLYPGVEKRESHPDSPKDAARRNKPRSPAADGGASPR